MNVRLYCQERVARLAAQMMLIVIGFGIVTISAEAQTRYSYLPSAKTNDGRFLSISGLGLQTLGDNALTFKIASPSNATAVEVGIFDGETGGTWDQGSAALEYTLYADPTGDATGTYQVRQWVGTSMPDNDWFNATVTNVAQARGANNNYFYILRVKSTNPLVFSWSSFKIRSTGSLAALKETSIAYTAPLGNVNDARIVYPNYPTLTPTTYDGSWNFFIDVPTTVTALTFWDGDMDRGGFDCTDNDNDDQDTPNGVLPLWSVLTDARAEGLAIGGENCMDASGNVVPGVTTSNPPDDSRNGVFRRTPSVSYNIVTPAGVAFNNNNPSGNLEWEQFHISTQAFNRATMDYHADALPAGFYQVQISGIDLSNLNAWRFPYDVVGVDTNGTPVPPIRPEVTNGTVEGTVFVDANANNTYDAGEAGFANVTLLVAADYNNDGIVDGTLTTSTDMNGKYNLGELRMGKYTATVQAGTLPTGMNPSYDSDGAANTPNVAAATLTVNARTKTMNFGYAPVCAPGTGTRGYWQNHPEAWPVQNIQLGSRIYTKAEAIAILATSVRGDKTYSMAAQLIATKLNLLMGNNSSCICSTVVRANNWLADHPVGSNVRSSNNAWSCDGSALHEKLDDYNNGDLCARHRDEVECNPGGNNNRNRWCRNNNNDDDEDDYRNYRGCRRNNGYDYDNDDDNNGNGNRRWR